MSGLFKTPAAPEIKPAVPLPNQEELKKARRRTIASESKSSGQTSTLLSTGGRETLGA